MCLRYNKIETNDLKASSEEKFTYYKILAINLSKQEILSPFQETSHGILEKDKIQTIKSDRKSSWFRKPNKLTFCEKRVEIVDNGIHVFKYKRDADRYSSKVRPEIFPLLKICVPVICFKKDLVAAGEWMGNESNDQAVFHKITLNHNDIIITLEDKYNFNKEQRGIDQVGTMLGL